MKCYVCAQKGIDCEAVAICIVCGMGLCMEHLVRYDLPIEDVIDWGLGQEIVSYPKTLPRILCIYCFEALVGQKGK